MQRATETRERVFFEWTNLGAQAIMDRLGVLA